jgi:hypothetical protein
MAVPIIVAGAAAILRFLASKGLPAAIKKFGKKQVTNAKKHAKDLVTKPNPGQVQSKSGVKGMRNYRTGQRTAALVGAGAIAVPAKNKIDKLKEQRKNAKTKIEKMKLTKRIDDGLLKIKQDELDAAKLKNKKGVTKSLVPTAKKMNKGGMPKKSFAKPGSYSSAYNKGGALQKTSPSQKGLKKLSTSVRNKMGYMSKGGMASKKGKK